jgi:hypothetical protein
MHKNRRGIDSPCESRVFTTRNKVHYTEETKFSVQSSKFKVQGARLPHP